MGGEPGGRGRGGEAPVYKCTSYKGGPGACPRFGRLGSMVRLG